MDMQATTNSRRTAADTSRRGGAAAALLAVLAVLAPPAARADSAPGLLGEYYSFGGQSVSSMPDFDALLPDVVRVETNLAFASTSEPWPGLGSGFRDGFAARYRGFVDIPAAGAYRFHLASDDGSALFLGGALLVDNGGTHAMRELSADVELPAGPCAVEVRFFESTGGAGLRLSWEGPGIPKEAVPAYALSHDPSCESAPPEGFARGLWAEFFDLSARPSSVLPDVRGRVPDAELAAPSVDFPASYSAWPGLPAWMEDDFAARFTGFVAAPTNGVYVFALTCDDGARLVVDGETVVEVDGINDMARRTGAAELSAGLHRLRVDYFERGGRAGLLLAWSGPGFSEKPVQPTALLRRLDADFDADMDGMPDAWEETFGLDPDDPSDAQSDLDGDGQQAVSEFLAGTDPARWNLAPESSLRGLLGEYFAYCGALQAIPGLGDAPADLVRPEPSLAYGDGALAASLASSGFSPPAFAARYSGYLRVPSAGPYRIALRSDDGSRLFLDGVESVSNDGVHDASERSFETWLEAGDHPLLVEYFDNGGRGELSLCWESDAFAREPVPASALLHAPWDVPPAPPPPAGFAWGAEASFYGLADALSAMPVLAGLAPDFTGTVARIDYPATASAWDGLPAGMADRFAAVFEGGLFVPESGLYALALGSDDGASLEIDGVEVFADDGVHSYSVRSAALPLGAGVHPFRVRYFENAGEAGLRLLWAPPGETLRAVPANRFVLASGNPDSDSDGMPDWWEERHDLDASDPSDASPDPDNDGLSNLAEYSAGTDPHSSDSDSDGMPDAWEIANGLCPFVNDALADPDSDGLVNAEEMRCGTDPLASDTDGDGADDGTEVRNTRGNPLVADINWAPAAIGGTVSGSSFIASTGTWRTEDDGTAFAAERAGSLTWNLAVPEGGADALAVRVGQHNFYAKTDSFDLSLFVDGLFVARQVVSAPYGTTEDAYFFLPEIPAGTHEFRLVWHNWEVNTFLAVYDLRFVNFGGPDADGDCVADWKEHRADEATDVADLPLESLVSPLCVEGRDLWRDVLEVEVAYPETNATFATVKTIGDGFYADIPLPANGSATISLRDRSLAGSFNVAWKPFDVFAEDYATNALVIRTGDALKIAPYEGAESEVSISVADGTNRWTAVTNWTESAATPYVFETEGLYLVSVAHEGLVFDDTAYAIVEVVRSRFPKRNPAILQDANVTLACPELSPRNLLEHDSELQLSAEVSGDGVKLSLLTHADRDLGLVSRLDDGGAISDAVQVTPVWADNGTYYRVAETYPDGSQLVEVSLLLGAVPEGTTVDLEIFVSGVTFDDGTRNKTLTADDFDANGHITLRFIKARGVTTSVCHRTYIYQNGELIYTNK